MSWSGQSRFYSSGRSKSPLGIVQSPKVRAMLRNISRQKINCILVFSACWHHLNALAKVAYLAEVIRPAIHRGVHQPPINMAKRKISTTILFNILHQITVMDTDIQWLPLVNSHRRHYPVRFSIKHQLDEMCTTIIQPVMPIQGNISRFRRMDASVMEVGRWYILHTYTFFFSYPHS